MEAATAAVVLIAFAALLAQSYLHSRALERQRQQAAELINDLASRIVRPAAPVPSDVRGRNKAPAPDREPRQHPDAALVGSVAPPAADGPEA